MNPKYGAGMTPTSSVIVFLPALKNGIYNTSGTIANGYFSYVRVIGNTIYFYTDLINFTRHTPIDTFVYNSASIIQLDLSSITSIGGLLPGGGSTLEDLRILNPSNSKNYTIATTPNSLVLKNFITEVPSFYFFNGYGSGTSLVGSKSARITFYLDANLPNGVNIPFPYLSMSMPDTIVDILNIPASSFIGKITNATSAGIENITWDIRRSSDNTQLNNGVKTVSSILSSGFSFSPAPLSENSPYNLRFYVPCSTGTCVGLNLANAASTL
jgi:hypothetical protein